MAKKAKPKVFEHKIECGSCKAVETGYSHEASPDESDRVMLARSIGWAHSWKGLEDKKGLIFCSQDCAKETLKAAILTRMSREPKLDDVYCSICGKDAKTAGCMICDFLTEARLKIAESKMPKGPHDGI